MRFQEPYILSWNEWNGNDPIHLLINFYSDVGIFRPSLEELEQFFQSDTTISLSQDKESIIQKLSECHNDPLMISLLFVNFLVEVLPSERVKWQPIGHRCVTHIMRSMNDMDSFVHSLLLTRSWIRDWRIVHYEQHTQISSFDSELLRAYVKDDLANEILDTSTSTSGSSSSSLEKEYFFRLWKETHFQI